MVVIVVALVVDVLVVETGGGQEVVTISSAGAGALSVEGFVSANAFAIVTEPRPMKLLIRQAVILLFVLMRNSPLHSICLIKDQCVYCL